MNVARLSVAGGLAVLATVAGGVEVTIEDGLVSVEAEDVAVQEILDELAKLQGLRLVQKAGIDRRTSIRARHVTVPYLLDEVLELSDSYQLFLPNDGRAPNETSRETSKIPPTLWIFAEGTGDDYATSFFETVLVRGDLGDRREAVRRLRELATPTAVNALSVALGDSDERIRAAAIEALTDIGTEDALAAMASMIADDDPGVRARAAESLGRFDGDSAGLYLQSALTDPDPRVRMAAADGLADLERPGARRQLSLGLDDPDPAVRQRAVEILEDLDDEAMFRALFMKE